MNARAGLFVEKLQTDPGQETVQAGERDQISDAAESHQIEETAQIGFFALGKSAGFAQGLAQGDKQEKGDADAGEILEGKGATGLVGIDQGVGTGQFFGNLMMIGDDEIETQLPGAFRFGDGGDAAIDGDHHRNPLGHGRFEGFDGETVTILEAQRDVVINLQTELGKAFGQQGGSSDAVDVVIAVDTHALMQSPGPQQTDHRALHPEQREGIGQIRQLTVNEKTRLVRRINPPGQQNARRQGGQVEGPGQLPFPLSSRFRGARYPMTCAYRFHEIPTFGGGASRRGSIRTRPR